MTEETWRDGLPADLVAAPFFRSADTLEQAIADMTHAADSASNSLRVPGPDADDAARQAFYDRVVEKAPGLMPKPDLEDATAMAAVMRTLGLPEKSDEYAPPEIADYTMPDDKVAQLRTMAHKAGLTKKQFQAFIGEVMEVDKLSLHEQTTAHTTDIDALKGEWGAAYQPKLDAIAAMLLKTGAPEPMIAAIKAGEADGNSMRWFAGMVDSLGGEGAAIGAQGKDGGAPAGVMTTTEARAQLAEVMAKQMPPPGQPRPTSEQLKYLTARRMELHRLAYPNSTDDVGMLMAGPRGGG